MIKDLKCYFGMHRYKVLKTELVTDPGGIVVGKAIISVCECCGKVRTDYVRTVSEYKQ